MSTILRLKISKSRPVKRGHDHYWRVIRDLTEEHTGDIFCINDILDKCSGVKSSDVRLFLRLLAKSDIVEKIEPDEPGQPCGYVLKIRPIETPVLSRNGKTTSGQGQTNMWNTMRHLLKSGFSARELSIHASTVDVPITHSTAKSYVGALNRAGMLIVRGKGVATSYRLGGRDHTTVLHAIRKIAELTETDELIKADYEALQVAILEGVETTGSLESLAKLLAPVIADEINLNFVRQIEKAKANTCKKTKVVMVANELEPELLQAINCATQDFAAYENACGTFGEKLRLERFIESFSLLRIVHRQFENPETAREAKS